MVEFFKGEIGHLVIAHPVEDIFPLVLFLEKPERGESGQARFFGKIFQGFFAKILQANFFDEIFHSIEESRVVLVIFNLFRPFGKEIVLGHIPCKLPSEEASGQINHIGLWGHPSCGF